MIGCAEKFEKITTDYPETSFSGDVQKGPAPVSERSVLTQAEERVIKDIESRLSQDEENKAIHPTWS